MQKAEKILWSQCHRSKHSPHVVPGHLPEIKTLPVPHEGDSKTQETMGTQILFEAIH